MSKVQAPIKELSLLYRLLPPCLLSLFTVLSYWPSLRYDFQFDDIANIQKHFYIRHHSLKSLWFSDSRWISYWLNSLHYSLGKFDTFSYRLGNLLIHTINGSLLFFIILFALHRSKSSSFFKKNAAMLATLTSALFLLHPVQTQTVSYVIQGQLEGLACMAILGMTLTFLHLCYAQTLVRKMLLCSALFIIAAFSCCTKEIAIISPVLLLLIDWFFVAHGSWQSLRSRLLLHATLFMFIIGMYIWFLKPAFFLNIIGLQMEAKNNIGNIITQHAQEPIRPWPFFISQFKVILHYLWMFVWPCGISVEYDWVLCRSFFAFDCILPLGILIGLALGVFRILYTQRTHIIAFGALWFFICIAPRSSIIPSPELLVDYKTYTASIGWLLILACGILTLTEYLIRISKKAHSNFFFKPQTRILLSAAFALPLCFMTYKRNLVWSSGTEFWMNVIQNAPNKARAYNNYAVELSQKHKRYQDAIPYFKKAAHMDKLYSDPWNNIAVCYSYLNDIDNAILALRKSLAINPYYAEGYNNLATFYLQKKEYAASLECLNLALRMRPHYGKAYLNLGRVYAELNEPKKTLDALKKACTIADLDNEQGYLAYANVALREKEFDEAIWGYTKVLECNPNNNDALFTLANAYYGAKQSQQARTLYETLLARNSTDLRLQYNIGETYLMEENYTQAMRCFKQIEPHWENIPQARLRLAQCYEKTGNVAAARQELETLAGNNRVTTQIRESAHQLLAQLNTHYGDQLHVTA